MIDNMRSYLFFNVHNFQTQCAMIFTVNEHPDTALDEYVNICNKLSSQ